MKKIWAVDSDCNDWASPCDRGPCDSSPVKALDTLTFSMTNANPGNNVFYSVPLMKRRKISAHSILAWSYRTRCCLLKFMAVGLLYSESMIEIFPSVFMIQLLYTGHYVTHWRWCLVGFSPHKPYAVYLQSMWFGLGLESVQMCSTILSFSRR